MTRWLIIAAALALLFWLSATATLRLVGQGGGDLVKGTEIAVPSGQQVWFLDRDISVSGDAGQMGDALRGLYRFVAPGIGGDAENRLQFEIVSGDLLHLCGVVRAISEAENSAPPEQIVIAMAAKETPQGSSDPGVVKYFEAFQVADGTCIREVF